jgi:hypothetical protein
MGVSLVPLTKAAANLLGDLLCIDWTGNLTPRQIGNNLIKLAIGLYFLALRGLL